MNDNKYKDISTSSLGEYIGLLGGVSSLFFIICIPIGLVYYYYSKDKFKKTLSKAYEDIAVIEEYYKIYNENNQKYHIAKIKNNQSNKNPEDYFSYYDILYNLDISLSALKDKSEFIKDDIDYVTKSPLNKADLSTIDLSMLDLNYDSLLSDVKSEKIKLYNEFNDNKVS